MIEIKPINNSKWYLHLKQLANLQVELIRSTNNGAEMKMDKLGHWHYLKMAKIYHIAGQFEEALNFYDDAIASENCCASAFFFKCELFFMLNRVEEGVALITQFTEQQEHPPLTYLLISKHFDFLGKTEESTFWWEKYQDRVHSRDIINKHLSLISGEQK